MFDSRIIYVKTRLGPQSGIAIGPILFIIAILAILAAAIAAGSGSFTASTSTESDKTKASTLIQIGDNLKVGYDRVTSNGTAVTDVIIDDATVTDTVDLFAPTGGGVQPPSLTMASDPANDTWVYIWADVTNVGLSGNPAGLDRLATLKVSSTVCNQINVLLNMPTPYYGGGKTTTGETFGVSGNFTNSTVVTTWSTTQKGYLVGCQAHNSGGPTDYYFFYQVLGIQ